MFKNKSPLSKKSAAEPSPAMFSQALTPKHRKHEDNTPQNPRVQIAVNEDRKQKEEVQNNMWDISLQCDEVLTPRNNFPPNQPLINLKNYNGNQSLTSTLVKQKPKVKKWQIDDSPEDVDLVCREQISQKSVHAEDQLYERVKQILKSYQCQIVRLREYVKVLQKEKPRYY